MPPPPPPPPVPSVVTISGTITFDDVPVVVPQGTNFSAITQQPVRGTLVEAVSSSGAVLATDQTSLTGTYSLEVPSEADVSIRVLAQIQQNDTASWDVSVLDNTNGDALYALSGALTNSGIQDSVRDLNASSTNAARSGAPFAILDPIYDTLVMFSAIDPDITFPQLDIHWSVNNIPVFGDSADGELGSSFYRSGDGIFILGDQNTDADEFDSHVIVHEWGHYYEDQISRSDSVGGPHGGGDRLDPRVAFSEGWGNALSAMILDDPLYLDSFVLNGNNVVGGFNVENNNNLNEGWFSEGSVQSIMYDIFDSANDGADVISEGLSPIHEAFISSTYINTPVFTTIFAYLESLRGTGIVDNADLNALLAEQSINGTGITGLGESNDGNIDSSLPVYNRVIVNGPPVEICSVDDAGEFNKLGNRAYLTLTIPSAGSYDFSMERISGDISRDPDFDIFQNGAFVTRAISGAINNENATRLLAAGEYVIDAMDFFNLGETVTQFANRTGDSCYNFTVSQ